MQPDRVTADITKSRERKRGTDISVCLTSLPILSASTPQQNDKKAEECHGGGQKDQHERAWRDQVAKPPLQPNRGRKRRTARDQKECANHARETLIIGDSSGPSVHVTILMVAAAD